MNFEPSRPLRPLTFDFAMMSDLAQRPPHSIGRDEQLLALEEELTHRVDHYPRMVKDCRIKEDDARRHVAIWRQLVEEVRLDAAAISDGWSAALTRQEDQLRLSAFTWDDKVREIRRELAIRRGATPGQIQRRRIAPDQARLRLERLDGLHWLYFFKGHRWDWQLVAADGLAARFACRAFNGLRSEWLEAAPADDRAAQAWLDHVPGLREWLGGSDVVRSAEREAVALLYSRQLEAA
jgi:hypothetical protein